VPPGAYALATAVRGYNPTVQDVTVGADGLGAIEATVHGPAAMQAAFVSALTGGPAPGVAVRCARERDDGTFPDPAVAYELAATADEEGHVLLFGAPYGELRCHASGDAFGSTVFDATLARGATTALPPIAVTPPPPPGALRIVLTWGQAPSDLDSHLTGPDGAGGRFHIYFGDRFFGQSLLDVDDTSSYGPETITVIPEAAGTYRYSVHNWSDQSASGALGIAASPARVEVHDHQGLVCAYRAPGALQGGNTWRVFETEARAQGGAFHLDAPCTRGARNLEGLGYVLAGGSGDAGVFLTELPEKPAGH
jgi:hypothetical protein